MSLISNAQKNIKQANKKGKGNAAQGAKSATKTAQQANIARKPVKTGGTRGS